MDGGGFHELSISAPYAYYSPYGVQHLPPSPPPDSYSFAGNHPYGFPNSDFPQSGSSSYQSINYLHGGGVGDENYDPLELEFSRMSLLPSQPHHHHQSELLEMMNLQRMRAESAARAQNMANLLTFNRLAGYNNPGVDRQTSSLSESRGAIVSAAMDQSGCRFLQKKFEQGNRDDIGLIFSELKDRVCELMVHQFGNYLMQSFFKFVDEDQMTQLLCLLTRDRRKFKHTCTDMHGTRAVQKMLEHLSTRDQRAVVVSSLSRIALALIKNNNGQHVIQQCLRYFSPEDNKPILNVVADNCLDVATDKSGCCVLQQCLTHSVGESRDRLFAQIISNALFLSEHPYGNYVVQYILGFKIPEVMEDVMVQLFGNYVSLSVNKYGSNVIEACMKNAEGNQALPIVEELINSPDLLRVLTDQYANYVAQRAMELTKGAAQQVLIRLVLSNAPSLQSHPCGKRVLACARRLYRLLQHP